MEGEVAPDIQVFREVVISLCSVDRAVFVFLGDLGSTMRILRILLYRWPFLYYEIMKCKIVATQPIIIILFIFHLFLPLPIPLSPPHPFYDPLTFIPLFL